MKRFLILLLILSAPLAHAATWYATSSSVNINAANLWVPTSTGSCTGSGTALVWGAQADGDIFNANGCTSLAINTDPGGASIHVTLTTDATNGGGFTYATATNITIHAHILATKTPVIGTLTGSTGGMTIIGNVTAGTGTGARGIYDTHTVVTVNVTGNLQGAFASNAQGYVFSGATGSVSVTGNASTGGNGAEGLIITGAGSAAISGSCTGSDTNSAISGCNATGAGAITVSGSLISGTRSEGAMGNIRWTPCATCYALFPIDSSYTAGTINSHAAETPHDPGVTNVLSGVHYGSFTGTLSTSGGVCASSNW